MITAKTWFKELKPNESKDYPKPRSRLIFCNWRDAHSNLLDAAIVKKVKKLAGNDSTFLTRPERRKWLYIGNREEYDKQLASQDADVLSALDSHNSEGTEEGTEDPGALRERGLRGQGNPRTNLQREGSKSKQP